MEGRGAGKRGEEFTPAAVGPGLSSYDASCSAEALSPAQPTSLGKADTQDRMRAFPRMWNRLSQSFLYQNSRVKSQILQSLVT